MRHGAQNYNNMNYKNTMNVASVSTASRQTQYRPGLDYDTAITRYDCISFSSTAVGHGLKQYKLRRSGMAVCHMKFTWLIARGVQKRLQRHIQTVRCTFNALGPLNVCEKQEPAYVLQRSKACPQPAL